MPKCFLEIAPQPSPILTSKENISKTTIKRSNFVFVHDCTYPDVAVIASSLHTA